MEGFVDIHLHLLPGVDDGPPDVAVYPEVPPPAGDRPWPDGPPDLAADDLFWEAGPAGIRPGDGS